MERRVQPVRLREWCFDPDPDDYVYKHRYRDADQDQHARQVGHGNANQHCHCDANKYTNDSFVAHGNTDEYEYANPDKHTFEQSAIVAHGDANQHQYASAQLAQSPFVFGSHEHAGSGDTYQGSRGPGDAGADEHSAADGDFRRGGGSDSAKGW